MLYILVLIEQIFHAPGNISIRKNTLSRQTSPRPPPTQNPRLSDSLSLIAKPAASACNNG